MTQKSGGIELNNTTYKQFASAMLAIAPDFPMDAAEIEAHLKANGFSWLSKIMDSHDTELSEVMRLLSVLSRGGASRGEG